PAPPQPTPPQHAPPQPAPPQHALPQPAPRGLCGWPLSADVADDCLPALAPGEVRLCGLTFSPDLAPAVSAALEEVEQLRRSGKLRNMFLEDIIQIPPSSMQQLRRLMQEGNTAEASVSEPFKAEEQCDYAKTAIRNDLARLLGLLDQPDRPLPEGSVLAADVLAPGRDPARGGAGLFAAKPIEQCSALGVVGGYVMPRNKAALRVRRLGAPFPEGSPEQAELLRRARGQRQVAQLVWRVLAGGLRMPFASSSAAAAAEDGDAEQDGSAEGSLPYGEWDIMMLGYGNATALVNDPRMRSFAEAPTAAANCIVLPVLVFGIPLPVLVATRHIAEGRQLLREYGADWWRGQAQEEGYLSKLHVPTEQIFHSSGELEGLLSYEVKPPQQQLQQPPKQQPLDQSGGRGNARHEGAATEAAAGGAGLMPPPRAPAQGGGHLAQEPQRRQHGAVPRGPAAAAGRHGEYPAAAQARRHDAPHKRRRTVQHDVDVQYHQQQRRQRRSSGTTSNSDGYGSEGGSTGATGEELTMAVSSGRPAWHAHPHASQVSLW
ncbi:hypothetical protein Agub_g9731, partial [Astrephomene gubernaculifera]